MQIKIGDLGNLSKRIDSNNIQLNQDIIFSGIYSCPEVFKFIYTDPHQQFKEDFSLDIWSLGMTLFFLFFKNKCTINYLNTYIPWISILLLNDDEIT